MKSKKLFAQPAPQIIRHGRTHLAEYFLNHMNQIMWMTLLIDQDSVIDVEWLNPILQHAGGC